MQLAKQQALAAFSAELKFGVTRAGRSKSTKEVQLAKQQALAAFSAELKFGATRAGHSKTTK